MVQPRCTTCVPRVTFPLVWAFPLHRRTARVSPLPFGWVCARLAARRQRRGPTSTPGGCVGVYFSQSCATRNRSCLWVVGSFVVLRAACCKPRRWPKVRATVFWGLHFRWHLHPQNILLCCARLVAQGLVPGSCLARRLFSCFSVRSKPIDCLFPPPPFLAPGASVSHGLCWASSLPGPLARLGAAGGAGIGHLGPLGRHGRRTLAHCGGQGLASNLGF